MATDQGTYDDLISSAASRYGVPADTIKSIIKTESGFNPSARGSSGEYGLMQLMPTTAKDLGVTNPLDPAQNIDAGTKYYSQMLRQFGGDTQKALAAYNWGVGNVSSDKPFPQQVLSYIGKVLGPGEAQAGELPAGWKPAGNATPKATGSLPEGWKLAEEAPAPQPERTPAGEGMKYQPPRQGLQDAYDRAKGAVVDMAKPAMPYVRTGLEASGAVLGGLAGGGAGLLTGPGAIAASPVGAGVGGALGYAMGSNVAGQLEQLLGQRKPESLSEATKTTAKDLATGLAMESVGPALSLGGKGISNVYSALTGKSPTLLGEAYKGTPSFMDAMRGNISPQKMVGQAKQAYQALDVAEKKAYTEFLGSFEGINKPVPGAQERISSLWDSLLNDWKVSRSPEGALDFAGHVKGTSKLGATEQSEILTVDKMVREWGDNPANLTPAGLDTLKQKLDAFYEPNSMTRSLLGGLRSKIKNMIIDSGLAPKYESAEANYAALKRSQEKIAKELFVGGKAKDSTTINALMKSMDRGGDKELKREIVDILDPSEKLRQTISGRNMSEWVESPSLFHPLSVLTSPRITGEAAALAGKASPYLDGTQKMFVPAGRQALTSSPYALPPDEDQR